MEYVSLIVNEDAAHLCLGELGKLGVISFSDVRESLAPLDLHHACVTRCPSKTAHLCIARRLASPRVLRRGLTLRPLPCSRTRVDLSCVVFANPWR